MRRIGVYSAWGAVVALCVLLAIMAGNAWALAIALVVAVLPPVGLLAVRVAARDLTLQLASPTTAQAGSQVACSLVIANASLVPLLRVSARIEGVNMLTGQRFTRELSAAVAPRARSTIGFIVENELCGRVRLEVGAIEVYEPFSIFRVRRPADAVRRFSVMPTLHDMHLRDMMAAAPLSDTVTFSPYRRGSDASEVFALREYEQGDDIRRIHWKLSEKIDELVVREASLPIDNSVLVLWDKNLFGTPADPRRAAGLAELLLALCEMLCAQGISYDVVFNDVATGRCLCERVTTDDDLYGLIGSAMSTPLGEAGESLIAAYTRLYGPLQASRVFCLACAEPDGLRAACRDKNLVMFLCDAASQRRFEPAYTEIHFAPNDVEGAIVLAEVA